MSARESRYRAGGATIAALAGLCLSASTVLAAEADKEHGASVTPSLAQQVAPAITAIVVFMVVLAVFVTVIWPKIQSGLSERAAKIREEIAAAEAARKQAKDALEEYEKSLSQARAEAQQMIEQTKADQAKLAQELRAKADTELSQMRERALRDIESAKRAAVNELYADAASLATQIAGKILQREITSEDHQKLVEDSIAELQGSAN